MLFSIPLVFRNKVAFDKVFRPKIQASLGVRLAQRSISKIIWTNVKPIMTSLDCPVWCAKGSNLIVMAHTEAYQDMRTWSTKHSQYMLLASWMQRAPFSNSQKLSCHQSVPNFVITTRCGRCGIPRFARVGPQQLDCLDCTYFYLSNVLVLGFLME